MNTLQKIHDQFIMFIYLYIFHIFCAPIVIRVGAFNNIEHTCKIIFTTRENKNQKLFDNDRTFYFYQWWNSISNWRIVMFLEKQPQQQVIEI